MKKITDLGLEFPTPTSRQRVRYGIFVCDECGSEFKCQSYNIETGKTKSCGCLISKAKRVLPTGVYQRQNGNFKAILFAGGKQVYIGDFTSPAEAERAIKSHKKGGTA
jgi:hypothetical protein